MIIEKIPFNDIIKKLYKFDKTSFFIEGINKLTYIKNNNRKSFKLENVINNICNLDNNYFLMYNNNHINLHNINNNKILNYNIYINNICKVLKWNDTHFFTYGNSSFVNLYNIKEKQPILKFDTKKNYIKDFLLLDKSNFILIDNLDNGQLWNVWNNLSYNKFLNFNYLTYKIIKLNDSYLLTIEKGVNQISLINIKNNYFIHSYLQKFPIHGIVKLSYNRFISYNYNYIYLYNVFVNDIQNILNVNDIIKGVYKINENNILIQTINSLIIWNVLTKTYDNIFNISPNNLIQLDNNLFIFSEGRNLSKLLL